MPNYFLVLINERVYDTTNKAASRCLIESLENKERIKTALGFHRKGLRLPNLE